MSCQYIVNNMLTQYGDQQSAKTTTTMHSIRARWISFRLADTMGCIQDFLSASSSVCLWLLFKAEMDDILISNVSVGCWLVNTSSVCSDFTEALSIASFSLQVVVVSLVEEVSPICVNVVEHSLLLRVWPPVITFTTARKWIFLRCMTRLFRRLTSRRIKTLQMNITMRGHPKQHVIMKMA